MVGLVVLNCICTSRSTSIGMLMGAVGGASERAGMEFENVVLLHHIHSESLGRREGFSEVSRWNSWPRAQVGDAEWDRRC